MLKKLEVLADEYKDSKDMIDKTTASIIYLLLGLIYSGKGFEISQYLLQSSIKNKKVIEDDMEDDMEDNIEYLTF